MNYEQLDIYFGPPGMCSFTPARHISSVLNAESEFTLYTLEMCRPSWRQLFANLRQYKKTLYQRFGSGYFSGIILRTGVLRPTSVEGASLRGAVVLHGFSFDKPLGPSSMDLYRTNYLTVRHWSKMPRFVPLAPWDDKLPELCSVWYAGYTGYAESMVVHDALGIPTVEWEDLL